MRRNGWTIIKYRMNLNNRSSVFLLILMVFLILLPLATGLLGLIEDNDLFDEDDLFTADSFIVAWYRIVTHHMLLGLIFGMSIFALFVVYLGGRPNHRRFNDRTIDFINVLRGIFFRDGSFRSRLCFSVR